MKKFRVVRSDTDATGAATFSHGRTYTAASAREAVALDNKAMRHGGPLGVHAGATTLPITAVYELQAVPASEWR